MLTLITILVFILLSAFFSGMEIAFLSSNRLKLEIDKKQNRVFGYIAGLFSRYPGQYITTILVGNNIALVVYSLMMSTFIQSMLVATNIVMSDGAAYAIETLLSTLIILMLAEFVPKALVRLNPNFYYRTFIVPVYFFFLLFYPIAKATTLLAVGIFKLFRLPMQKERTLGSFDKTDLAHLLDEVSDAPSPQQNETDIRLLQNALDFSERQVRDCMTPRVDIEAIDRTSTVEEANRRFVETQFSRLLIYDETIDNIIGFIHNKSLFQHPRSIMDILTKVEYVPESMPTRKLLSIFIKRHHSVAVVIDEFGGTAGMVTIEDTLEEIFGEIEDEHDSPQDLVEKRINDHQYIFSGRLEIDALNEKYGLGLPVSEAYDTLAGYVIERFQGIPKAGDTIDDEHRSIRILRVSASKVELVRLTTNRR